MSELSEAVEPVQEQVEEAAQTFRSDGQAVTEFAEQLGEIQSKVDEIQTLLRGVSDAVAEVAIMMDGVREASTRNMNLTGAHAIDTVRLLDIVLRVVGDSGNEHARAAAENVDKAHPDASVSSRLHKAIKLEATSSSLFLTDVREAIGSVAAKLTAFYDRTAAMQDTSMRAAAASEAAATKTSAAAQELESYKADVA